MGTSLGGSECGDGETDVAIRGLCTRLNRLRGKEGKEREVGQIAEELIRVYVAGEIWREKLRRESLCGVEAREKSKTVQVIDLLEDDGDGRIETVDVPLVSTSSLTPSCKAKVAVQVDEQQIHGGEDVVTENRPLETLEAVSREFRGENADNLVEMGTDNGVLYENATAIAPVREPEILLETMDGKWQPSGSVNRSELTVTEGVQLTPSVNSAQEISIAPSKSRGASGPQGKDQVEQMTRKRFRSKRDEDLRDVVHKDKQLANRRKTADKGSSEPEGMPSGEGRRSIDFERRESDISVGGGRNGFDSKGGSNGFSFEGGSNGFDPEEGRNSIGVGERTDYIDVGGLQNGVGARGTKSSVSVERTKNDVDVGGQKYGVDVGWRANDVDVRRMKNDVDGKGGENGVDTGGRTDDVDVGGRRNGVDARGKRNSVNASRKRDGMDAGRIRRDVDRGGMQNGVNSSGKKNGIGIGGEKSSFLVGGMRDGIEQSTLNTVGLIDSIVKCQPSRAIGSNKVIETPANTNNRSEGSSDVSNLSELRIGQRSSESDSAADNNEVEDLSVVPVTLKPRTAKLRALNTPSNTNVEMDELGSDDEVFGEEHIEANEENESDDSSESSTSSSSGREAVEFQEEVISARKNQKGLLELEVDGISTGYRSARHRKPH